MVPGAGAFGHWENGVWVPDEITKFGVTSEAETTVPWWAWLVLGWLMRDVIRWRAAR
jgi:hypothetical protein